jgi:uncharacterized protein with von Willebrand factor type A (vWA) domain
MKKLLEEAAVVSRNIIIVLTDGISNHPDKTRQSAIELKQIENIEIYAVGIGSANNIELQAITTSPDHVFSSAIDKLNEHFQEIAAEIAPCRT